MVSAHTTQRSHRAPRAFSHTAILLILLPILIPALATPGQAASAEALTTKLPTARWGTSAAWAGTEAYIIGGSQSGIGSSNEILRFDPATGTLTVAATMPNSRFESAAVWTGRYLHVFGGGGCKSPDPWLCPDSNVRYDPILNTVSYKARLPSARVDVSAVFDGRFAYVFGGNNGAGGLFDTIVRYDPDTDTMTTLPARLPSARAWTAAAWDGRHAYIFGGSGSAGALDEIVKFNPATGSVSVAQARLPFKGGLMSAAYDGTAFYLFGGSAPGGLQTTIVRYDPVADTATLLPVTLPSARQGTSAVFDGNGGYAYVFGGNCGSSCLLDQIVKFVPPSMAVAPIVPVPGIPPGAPGYVQGIPQFGAPVPLEGISFTMDMADMAWKAYAREAATYELRLVAKVAGMEPEGWSPPPGPVVVADLYWNGFGPYPVTGSGFVETPSGHEFVLDPVRVEATIVDSGTSNVVRIVPRHDAGAPAWVLTVHAAVMELAAAPVVILHGWDLNPFHEASPDAPHWAAIWETNMRASAVAAYGRDPWAWLDSRAGGVYSYGYDAKQDFRASASTLSNRVLGFKDASSYDGKVVLAAHSMGGLVSRYYLESLDGRQHVSKLVTAGTPHHGSSWANLATVFVDEFIRRGEDYNPLPPPAFYLTPEGDGLGTRHFSPFKGFYKTWKNWWGEGRGAFRYYDSHDMLADFELMTLDKNPILKVMDWNPRPEGVSYFYLAGETDVRYTASVAGETISIPLVRFAGDDVVSTESATRGFSSTDCWRVVPYRGSDVADLLPGFSMEEVVVHTAIPLDPRIHAYTMAYATRESPGDLCQGGSLLAEAASGAEAGTSPEEGDRPVSTQPLRAVPSGTPGNGAVARTETLVAAQAAEFVLYSYGPDGAVARFALVGPDGTRIEPETAFDLGANFTERSRGGITEMRYAVVAPADGNWTFEATPTGATPENGTTVGFALHVRSAARVVRVSEEAPREAGTAANLTVRVSRGGVALTGAAVQLEVQDAGTGAMQQVALVDDGAHGDGEAGDGVYGGQYTGLSGGVHQGVVTAMGDVDGEPYLATLNVAMLFEARADERAPTPAACIPEDPSVLVSDPEGASEVLDCLVGAAGEA